MREKKCWPIVQRISHLWNEKIKEKENTKCNEAHKVFLCCCIKRSVTNSTLSIEQNGTACTTTTTTREKIEQPEKSEKNNKKSEYSKIVHATSLMHSQHIHAMKN